MLAPHASPQSGTTLHTDGLPLTWKARVFLSHPAPVDTAAGAPI